MKYAVVLLLLLTGCAKKPVKTPYQVIIPHDCVQSDITCNVYPGKKKMDCDFKKFTSCEVLKVNK